LYLDINLEFEITNTGEISEIYIDDANQNIQLIGATFSQVMNQSVDYYSYSTLDSSIEIYGGIGITLRIAQPGWLTTGLGFFYEDPMFLEGIWSYNITQSEGPMATTNGIISNLANTSVTFTLIEEIVENNTIVDDTNNSTVNDGNNSTTDDSNNTSNDNNSNQSGNDDEAEEEDMIVEDASKDSKIDISIMMLSAGAIGLLTILLLITFMIRRK
jgi:hypothetical protein